MNAREYLETVALPIFVRLKTEPYALELQVAATIIIFHTTDYIAESKGLSLPNVRDIIKRQVPDFDAIYAAAIANKHQIVKRDPSLHKGLTSPHQNTPNFLTLNGEAITLNGERLSCGTVANIVFQDGREIPLLETLQEIIVVLQQIS